MCEKSVVKKRGSDLNYMALRELRDKGGTYADVAEELGLSAGYITNCASGTPEAMLSMPNFIKLIESFKLTDTINNICLRAGGVFIPLPHAELTMVDIIKNFSKVIKEEGEDAEKMSRLIDGRMSQTDINAAITDIQETMQALATLMKNLEKTKEA